MRFRLFLALVGIAHRAAWKGSIAMIQEKNFRMLFIFAFIAMMGVRVYYQSKGLRDKRRSEIREGPLSLAAGSIAALTSIVFGAEYIFFPDTFSFAYVLRYPLGVRWLGAFMLLVGISLLALSHHHLGKSFHSLIVSKEEHALVTTGPYHWIRHPIYSAYLLNYVGGGLLSSNIVLTFVPVVMYAILVAIRMGQEEDVLQGLFGQEYREVMLHTGRLLPRIRRKKNSPTT